ncbi:hypothetical protein VUR80DRAFT_5067 [Thermomyces stellatus]
MAVERTSASRTHGLLFRKEIATRHGLIPVSALTYRQCSRSDSGTFAGSLVVTLRSVPCGNHGPPSGLASTGTGPFRLGQSSVSNSWRTGGALFLPPARSRSNPYPRPAPDPCPFPLFFHISSARIISGSGSSSPPLPQAESRPAVSVRNDDRMKQGRNELRNRDAPLSLQAHQSKSPFQHFDTILRSGALPVGGVFGPERTPVRFRGTEGVWVNATRPSSLQRTHGLVKGNVYQDAPGEIHTCLGANRWGRSSWCHHVTLRRAPFFFFLLSSLPRLC